MKAVDIFYIQGVGSATAYIDFRKTVNMIDMKIWAFANF